MTSKSKKAASGIIEMVIMIGLVIAITAIVWGVVNGIIGTQVKSTESCFGNFGKVSFNKQYTCANSAAGEVQFSLALGDLKIDGILVSLSGVSASKSFKIDNSTTFSYIKMYGGSYGGALSLPEKNSGLTYVVDLSGLGVSDATSIKVSPIISGNQCEVSDSINEL